MVVTLDDAKRTSIATKLASIKAVQELLIQNEQKLASEVSDEKIKERLHDFWQMIVKI